ncbi:MAG: VOC family protein [Hyphomicrobiales bacterium]
MAVHFTHCALHVRDVDASIAFYDTYCGLKVVHEHGEGAGRTVWLGEEGREADFVMVLVPGGSSQHRADGDMTHYGFALDSRAAVDRIARRGREAGCLFWEPQAFPDPVGYLCALEDPDGYVVEFSHGQPLGPGAGGLP